MKPSSRHLAAWLAPLLLALSPSPLPAHQLDGYLQSALVGIAPGEIRLQLNLTPGVAVAKSVITIIDRDRDGVISPTEAATYAERVNSDLSVRLDDRDVALKVLTSSFPEPAELRSGFGIIRMEFSVTPGTLVAGPHRLTIGNHHLAAVGAYLINAVKPDSTSIHIAGQTRNENQSQWETEFSFDPTPPQSR